MKSLDVMNLPPATSADSCPGCFYEPEFRYNNSQRLLWRPCVCSRAANVEQRRGSRRRRRKEKKKNVGDFLHDGSHHCRERSGEVERERGNGGRGGGVCMLAPVKERCSIWTIVSRGTLDASRQTSLPVKH